MVELSNGSYYYENNSWLSIPSYLSIENEILVGVLSDEFISAKPNDIMIPKIVTRINDHALDVTSISAELSGYIQTIYVPNSVNYLGDYAFANNLSLE